MVRKFLLIDDDQDDKEMFCEAMEAVDEKIVCYAETDGRRALEKLESKEIDQPDVIFLDINMPVMNGWQCLVVLKSNEAHKDIPVIMYSTSSLTEDIEKAHQLGAVSFMTKPTNFKSLTKSLEIVVRHVKAGSLQTLQPGSGLLTIASS